MDLRQEPRKGILRSVISLFEGPGGNRLLTLLLPILFLLALVLPPISLVERILDRDFQTIPRSGGEVSVADGARLTLPGEALENPVKVWFSIVSRQSFIEGTAGGSLQGAAAALPRHLIIKSPVYLARVKKGQPGHSVWALPIPRDSDPYGLLDSYAWDGTTWSWLPHRTRVESGQIETEADGVPSAIAIMQAQRVPTQIGAITGENPDFINQAGSVLTYLAPRLYLMQGDGSIGQLFTPSPIFHQSGALVIPTLHNIEPTGIVRSDLVDNLLIDPNAWQAHVDRIEAMVVGSGYDGILIDYRGVDPTLREQFSRFITTLGERLEAHNRVLAVRVTPPTPLAESNFETGAYDWQKIGQAATTVIVPLAREQAPFTEPEALRALLAYATSQVDRYELQIELPVAPYELAEEPRSLPYSQVSEQLFRMAQSDPSIEVEPGISVELLLPALERAGKVTRAGESESYQFDWDGRTIQLENGSSLARRLRLLDEYHIGGVVLVDAGQADPRVWEMLSIYQREPLPPAEAVGN